MLAGYRQQLLDPDLRPELELASHQPSETITPVPKRPSVPGSGMTGEAPWTPATPRVKVLPVKWKANAVLPLLTIALGATVAAIANLRE